uniref:ORMDL family protein n=1 Tax=Ascaris lumbricoides TaxID=6252 RepID=A0A0M3HR67_ASCLU
MNEGTFGDVASSKFGFIPKNVDHVLILRAAFFGHTLLTSVALLSSWPPTAFIFYNAIVISLIFWVLSGHTEVIESF